MSQFLVIAYDGTDAEAPARRRVARPVHFEGLKTLGSHVLAGGAILDDAGNMIGSAVVAEFPSRADLDAWLEREPYVKQGVWKNIEVRPYRMAVLGGKILV